MNKIIYQDQRIADEFCNFNCEYCGGFYKSEYSLRVDEKGNLNVPAEWHEKIKSMPYEVRKHFENGWNLNCFYNLGLDIINQTKKIISADILKISGGEITIYNKLVDFVRKIHNSYSVVQILTNGLNISEKDIIEYKKMGNICFQISIDGATHESNYSKSHSEAVTNRVLKNIDCLVKQQIGVEINCVLTKYNTDKLIDFYERYKDAKNFVIIPRPVRGEPKQLLNFSDKQILSFEKDINELFEKYSKILPPKKYFERLIEIMKKDYRTTECYIPFFVQSIDGYGNLEDCPIGLIDDVTDNIFNMEENIIQHKCFNDINLCKNCTNQYEMFNLYIEGSISQDDLRKLPSLNSDIIINHINEIKQIVINKKLKKYLKQNYNIICTKIEKNEESTEGNVYIISCEDKKYVIKIYNNLSHTESMINLHTKLYDSGIIVPKVIKTTNNNSYIKILNSYYCVVYSFLKDKPIMWNPETKKYNKTVIKNIARELKKIHLITKDYNEFSLPQISFENNEKSSNSVLHFDLTGNNLFMDENNHISFIDFDDAKFGNSICDVAILITNLFFTKTRGIDKEGMKYFIDSYYENERIDKEYLIIKIKEYALAWIDYILSGNEFDTSTKESLIIRKQLIEEYM